MAVIDLATQWEAFPALYERHHRDILRLCRGRLGNDHDAADAVQETFLRAWRALDGFGGERRVGPWLRTIAANVCVDALRSRNRAVPVPTFDATFDATVEPPADAPPDTAAVSAALARLSERHRDILQLREFQGLSYERIAEQQQLDLNAVKSLLWRARQSLRREFLLVTAEGRLSALGGLLLVRPMARLRGLLSDASSAVAQAGVAGGTAATAAVMTATVALPALGPSGPPPPPPPSPVVVVVAAAAQDTEAVVVPPSSLTLRHIAAIVPAASVVPTEVPPAATAERDEVKVERTAEKVDAKTERKVAQADAKAESEDQRTEAKAERTEAKEERKAEKAGEPAATEPPGNVAVAEPGQSGDRPDRGRGKDADS